MAEKKATLLLILKDQASTGLSKLGKGFNFIKSHALALTAAFAGIVAGVAKVLHAYSQQEAAEKALSAALKIHGDNVEVLMPKYKALAAEIQRNTTIGDENALALMGQMRHLGVMPSQMEAATKGAIGLANALNMDVNASTRYVALAMQGEYTVLQRYVPALRTATSEAEKKTIVMNLMANGYKAAMEEADTLAGATAQMKNVFGDLLEILGELIAGYAKDFVKWLKESLLYIQENRLTLAKWVNGIIFAGQVIGNVFGYIIAAIKNTAETLFSFGQGIGNLLTLKFKEAGNSFRDTLRNIKEATILNFGDMVSNIGESYQAMVDKNSEYEQAVLESQTNISTAVDTAYDHITRKQGESIKILIKNADAFTKLMIQLHKAETQVQQEELAARVKNTQDSLGFISSLSTSKNKELAAVGKAAAVAMATIDTYAAANKALASVPPPFNFGLAALVIAAGLANVAKITETNMAEGGIVMPRAGGTIARIGEAGKAEAVIPLDSAEGQSKLSGIAPVNINIYAGTLVADDRSIEELAEKIDEKLYKLRRNQEALAF